jgi:hypothetical protein
VTLYDIKVMIFSFSSLSILWNLPEPAMLLLLGLGMMTMGIFSRRPKKQLQEAYIAKRGLKASDRR